jgi:hypothetical protein
MLFQIIVYLAKAYEVFPEIFPAPGKLSELIRLDLRELAGEYLTRVGAKRSAIHSGCGTEAGAGRDDGGCEASAGARRG